MAINLSKLENVKQHGLKVIARCPACAETGIDRKGEHLFIEPSGRFGCVVFPGHEGHKHRQRIFELVGIKTSVPSGFKIRKPSPIASDSKPIQKDILGRLGHVQSTHARKDVEYPSSIEEDQNELTNTVPAVPTEMSEFQNVNSLSPQERQLLTDLDQESIENVLIIRQIFNGKIIAVKDLHR